VWWHLLSTLHPGLTDATVVDARYSKEFMGRNNPNCRLIVVNNQLVNTLRLKIFCNAKIGFKVLASEIVAAVAPLMPADASNRAEAPVVFVPGPTLALQLQQSSRP
jgi:hypothetical protein